MDDDDDNMDLTPSDRAWLHDLDRHGACELCGVLGKDGENRFGWDAATGVTTCGPCSLRIRQRVADEEFD